MSAARPEVALQRVRRATARLPVYLRSAVAAAVIAALVIGQSRHGWTQMAYRAAIHPHGGPSALELAKAYLPHIEGMRRVGFMASFWCCKT